MRFLSTEEICDERTPVSTPIRYTEESSSTHFQFVLPLRPKGRIDIDRTNLQSSLCSPTLPRQLNCDRSDDIRQGEHT